MRNKKSSDPKNKKTQKQKRGGQPTKEKRNRNPLQELLKTLHEIFPTGETINPFHRIKLRDYPTEYEHYLKLLTHYITQINQKHRAMEKQRFVTSREDIMASLNLLEIVVLKQYRGQKQQAEAIYDVLKANTKKGQLLSARNIAEIIQFQKSQTHTFIQILLEKKQLEKVGDTHPSVGFLYRLIQNEEETQETEIQEIIKKNQTKKRDPIADEIAEEFSDNENYYKNEF
jgi:hypothetical protein